MICYNRRCRRELYASQDEAQALREQIATLKQERMWRPIETAPRDGTEILCWCPGIGERVLCFDAGCWVLAGGDYANDYEPTHWMPLPPAPEVE